MTTTTAVTTETAARTVIAVIRSEHYAARRSRVGVAPYVVCACGTFFLDDITGEEGLRRHMAEQLGHRPQAIEIDRETGAMTIICTCGDQPPMTADGTAWDLHRVHAEYPTIATSIPEQRPAQDPCSMLEVNRHKFPYSCQVPTLVRDKLVEISEGVPGAMMVLRDSVLYLNQEMVAALRNDGPNIHICSHPAGEVLHAYAPAFPISTTYPLTYRVV